MKGLPALPFPHVLHSQSPSYPFHEVTEYSCAICHTKILPPTSQDRGKTLNDLGYWDTAIAWSQAAYLILESSDAILVYRYEFLSDQKAKILHSL